MALEKNGIPPEARDDGDMAPVSFFVASLAGKQDYASRLVYDLFIHEQMQVTHDPETGLFRTNDDVVRNAISLIGRGGWMTVNLLYDKDREPDDFWESLHNLIANACSRMASLRGRSYP